jgi:hypothetical protein
MSNDEFEKKLIFNNPLPKKKVKLKLDPIRKIIIYSQLNVIINLF